MSIINFDEINKGREATSKSPEGVDMPSTPAMGLPGLPELIKLQKAQVEAFYNEHLRTAKMFEDIDGLVKELLNRAGVREPVYPTPDLIRIIGSRAEDMLSEFSQSYGGKKVILCSDKKKSPYYAVTLKLNEKARSLPMLPADVIPVVDVYRITKGKCDVLDTSADGWARSSWREYVGLTKKQWEDVNKDGFLDEMMTAVIGLLDAPSDNQWTALKRIYYSFYQLCDIEPIFQMISVEAFGYDSEGLPRLVLVPFHKKHKGVAIGVEDGKLTLFLMGHSLYPVDVFEDTFDAACFIKNYYNKFNSGKSAAILPVSKKRVLEIDDIESFSVYDFDAAINNTFPAGSISEKERNATYLAKKVYVDIVTDNQLLDGLASACVNRFSALLDETIEGLFDE